MPELQEFSLSTEKKKHAEFITGQALRQYMADKVKKYLGHGLVSVFDGAAGSGQLEQYIDLSELVAVEIQADACKALAHNRPNAIIHNMSFFEFDCDVKTDCVVMNPPFSLKFKDLSDAEKTKIQKQFTWKKSGVVDDIFVLKSMEYSQRFGFFILFLGLTYRSADKQFRELVGNQIAELNVITNGFDDTPIDVLFLVLDKQKTANTCRRELYDCKTGQIVNQDTWAINADTWERVQPPEPPKEEIDPIATELLARSQAWQSLKAQIMFSKVILEFEPTLKDGFNDWLDDMCHKIQSEKIA